MSRLSREGKREERRGTGPAAPVDVRVSEEGDATVDGVPLVAPAGREIQHAVLDHLHRLAIAIGHPVQAAIHDARVGYVIRLQVATDGASHFTGDPTRITTPRKTEAAAKPSMPTAEPARDVATVTPLRSVPEPVPSAERSVAEPGSASVPACVPRLVPDAATGTVRPPTGVFGPPPVMPTAATRSAGRPHLTVPPRPADPPRFIQPAPVPPVPEQAPAPSSAPPASAPADAPPASEPPKASRPSVADFPVEQPYDPTPTPARGFDAVAEAVLGDGNDDGGEALGEPTARINEAVRAGRIDEAAELAHRTVGTASADLGPEHAEVLRLRELTAYIAYLSGDPLEAFEQSLDLARLHHRARDHEAAYGNVVSAATAWRAVRDAEQALRLGRDLIALWAELVDGEGPAADDIEELESARARMLRLTERAARAAVQPG
jgi:hypothetical protein